MQVTVSHLAGRLLMLRERVSLQFVYVFERGRRITAHGNGTMYSGDAVTIAIRDGVRIYRDDAHASIWLDCKGDE